MLQTPAISGSDPLLSATHTRLLPRTMGHAAQRKLADTSQKSRCGKSHQIRACRHRRQTPRPVGYAEAIIEIPQSF
jgi:hypothetical protein